MFTARARACARAHNIAFEPAGSETIVRSLFEGLAKDKEDIVQTRNMCKLTILARHLLGGTVTGQITATWYKDTNNITICGPEAFPFLKSTLKCLRTVERNYSDMAELLGHGGTSRLDPFALWTPMPRDFGLVDSLRFPPRSEFERQQEQDMFDGFPKGDWRIGLSLEQQQVVHRWYYHARVHYHAQQQEPRPASSGVRGLGPVPWDRPPMVHSFALCVCAACRTSDTDPSNDVNPQCDMISRPNHVFQARPPTVAPPEDVVQIPPLGPSALSRSLRSAPWREHRSRSPPEARSTRSEGHHG
jgi:hypothetical protein